MKKKIAALAGAGVLLLSMAGPAFGIFGLFGSDDLVINNINTSLVNRVMTSANTGLNSSLFGGLIMTGPAGATSMVTNGVNESVVGCGCFDDVTINNTHTTLNSVVTTSANTGLNHGGMFGGIGTGAAGATSMVSNWVNTSFVGM